MTMFSWPESVKTNFVKEQSTTIIIGKNIFKDSHRVREKPSNNSKDFKKYQFYIYLIFDTMSKLVLIYDSSRHKMEGCFSIVLSSKK